MKRFELPPAAIAAHVSAVAHLSAARPGADAKPADVKKPLWVADVLAGAEAVLSRYVESGGDGRPAGDAGMLAADWKAAAAVFTVGEVRSSPCWARQTLGWSASPRKQASLVALCSSGLCTTRRAFPYVRVDLTASCCDRLWPAADQDACRPGRLTELRSAGGGPAAGQGVGPRRDAGPGADVGAAAAAAVGRGHRRQLRRASDHAAGPATGAEPEGDSREAQRSSALPCGVSIANKWCQCWAPWARRRTRGWRWASCAWRARRWRSDACRCWCRSCAPPPRPPCATTSWLPSQTCASRCLPAVLYVFKCGLHHTC